MDATRTDGATVDVLDRPVPPMYRPRGFWPRRRLRLTMLGMLLLPLVSWGYGQEEMAQWSFPVGAGFTVVGVATRLWAAGWLRKHQALVTSGPYAWTRHPLYLGSGLVALGQGCMAAVPVAPPGFLALWLVLYLPAMREEEAYLRVRYGAAYQEYAARVPMLPPRLWPLPHRAGEPGQGARFSWRQVWCNREYEAVAVNVVAIAVYACLAARR